MATTAGQSPDGVWRGAGQALVRLYPMGVSLFWLAPLVVALVALPEFIQHVVEIRLGMFESREAFVATQLDSTRMAFGYAKAAGLFLTFFAAARFWWVREHGGRWWDVREIAWARLLLGVALFFGVGSLPELLRGRVDPTMFHAISIAWMILLLPSLFILLSGLFGDESRPINAFWRHAWLWLIMTIILALAGFVPAAWLHGLNHDWAFQTGPVGDWLLMIWDSVLVGFLAGLTGTALFLGYSAFYRRITKLSS